MPRADVGARCPAPSRRIVDYAFSNYRFWPLAPLALEAQGRRCDAAATLRRRPPPPDDRVLQRREPLRRGSRRAFHPDRGGDRRRVGGPDVVTLEEVQDDSGPAGKGDGVVTSRQTTSTRSSTASRPREARATKRSGSTRSKDGEGGQPGGNIRVALLLNPARVTLVKRGEAGPLDAAEPEGLGKKLHLTLSPGGSRPARPPSRRTEGEGVRRSLAVELLFRGKPLFVIANHLSSKSDDDRAFGTPSRPARRRPSRRLAQAREVASLRRSPPRGRPEGPGRRPRRPERLRALGVRPAPRRRAAREPRPARPAGEPLHAQLRGRLAGPRPRRRLPRPRAGAADRHRPPELRLLRREARERPRPGRRPGTHRCARAARSARPPGGWYSRPPMTEPEIPARRPTAPAAAAHPHADRLHGRHRRRPGRASLLRRRSRGWPSSSPMSRSRSGRSSSACSSCWSCR